MTAENVANSATARRRRLDVRLRAGAEANSRRLSGVRGLLRVHLGGRRHLRAPTTTCSAAPGRSGIWLWILAAVGQALVALVVAQFAARIALSGSSYQWASRLANPKIGWLFGWLTFWYLAIAVVAMDNALASQAFMPLFGMAENEDTARMITVVILVIQAVLVIASTRLLGMITSSAVGIELAIIVVLVIALAVVMVVHRQRRSGATSPRAGSPPTHRTTSPSAAG